MSALCGLFCWPENSSGFIVLIEVKKLKGIHRCQFISNVSLITSVTKYRTLAHKMNYGFILVPRLISDYFLVHI
jgi:hypothetical protein